VYWPAAGVLAFGVAGTERARVANTGMSITGKLGINTATPRTELDVPGITSMRGAFEETIIAAAALTGTVHLDLKTGTNYLNTANAVANWTFNIRGDATTTLDSLMAIGQTAVLSAEVPQGATAYRCTGITVDGNVPSSLKWQNGAPTTGNSSASDTYCIRVTKTGTATFVVRASLSREL
jgi:hypothetical protein